MQFYKFCSISQRSIVSLVTGKFWASSLNNMNDPFEDRFEDKQSYNLVNSFGVFCISGEKNEIGSILEEPLMWAHYASNHSGIAIGLTHEEENGETPFPMKYMSNDKIEENFKILLGKYNGRVEKMISPWAEIFFSFKPIFWKYENEFRQVHVDSANKYIDPRLKINEVVFGFRSKPGDELAIWSALRDTISYRKAINVNGRIEIIDYTPPKRIVTNNRYRVLLNNDEDIETLPEEKSIQRVKHKFE